MSYIFSDEELKNVKKDLKRIRNINYRTENLDYEKIIEMLNKSILMKYLPEPNLKNLKLLPPKENGSYRIRTEGDIIDMPLSLIPILEFTTMYGFSNINVKEKNIFINKKLFETLKQLIENFLKFSNKGKSLYNEICKLLDNADEFYNELRKMIKELEVEYDNEILEVLLLIPDLFVYLCRLLKIKEVSNEYKLKLTLAIIYFMVPLDILPEAIINGPFGYIDDSFWALKVIREGFSDELINAELMKEVWPGRVENLEKLNYYYDLLKKVLGSEIEDTINNFIRVIIKKPKPATGKA